MKDEDCAKSKLYTHVTPSPFLTQRSVMTGSIFELSQCRLVWVPHLKSLRLVAGISSITVVDGRALVPA
jgi:hypothetical protein